MASLKWPAVVVGPVMVTLLLLSCFGGDGDELQRGDDTNLTADDAIGRVKGYLASQTEVKREEKQVPYMRRVPCSQIDVDLDPNKNDPFLRKCKPNGSPYGYKEVPDFKTEIVEEPGPCQFPPVDGEWAAQYDEASDVWVVRNSSPSTGDMMWKVIDDTGEVHSDQPPC